MSKQPKAPAVLRTDVLEAPSTVHAPAALASDKLARIVIAEETRTAFARAAVLLRDGYVFCNANPPQTLEMIGQSVVTLVLGDPDAQAIAGAAASKVQALHQLRADERYAERAEARLREQQERDAKQAALTQEVAEAAARLKQLQQSLDA